MVKIFLLLTASALFCFAGEGERPKCDANTRGQLWPEVANESPAMARRMAQCGQLFLCTRGEWRYRWESLAVSIQQLTRATDDAGSQCNPPQLAKRQPEDQRTESRPTIRETVSPER